MKKVIRIASRQSPLALWQAQYIKASLLTVDPELDITIVGLTTQGDRMIDKPLTGCGGKLLFVKELQKALLDNTADIAVHSMKDLSVFACPKLHLAAICERADPRDAFISPRYSNICHLPNGAVIGTASPRRTTLLKSWRPDLKIKMLRGNVGTRLAQCKQSNYDATILAAAGLKRLQLDHHITQYLEPETFIPAIGQGAIGVECCEKDTELTSLLYTINHEETALCVKAERAVNRILGGDCHTPIAAYATIQHKTLYIHGMVGSLDGKKIIESKQIGSPENAIQLGQALGQSLLSKGAEALLKKE